MNTVESQHAGGRDLAARKVKTSCVSVLNSTWFPLIQPLELSVLVRAMEGPREDVTVLRELNLPQRTSRLIDVVSVDGRYHRDTSKLWEPMRGFVHTQSQRLPATAREGYGCFQTIGFGWVAQRC
jgi:hypothetical protein